MLTPKHPKSITLQLDTRNQKIDAINRLVARVGGMLGCDACGRLALIRFEALGDPPPELSKEGVLSMHTE